MTTSVIRQYLGQRLINPSVQFVAQSTPSRLFAPSRLIASLLLAISLAIPGLPVSSTASQSLIPANSPLSDGVYLYGQSPQPDVLGNAYIVLEVKGSKVIGAFYMPHSSFDCAYGNITAKELQVTIVDSYERTRYPYAIAVQQQQTVASKPGARLQPSITLKGFHPIATVSENDQRILGICKQEYGF